jgi:hypothetical protein
MIFEHQGYEYGDCADAGWISPSSAAAISKSSGPRVLASECRDRRTADKQIVAHEVNALQDHRNKRHARANWQIQNRRRPRQAEETVPSVRGLARLDRLGATPRPGAPDEAFAVLLSSATELFRPALFCTS